MSKKLLGTLIGILFFGILMAGATFAFFASTTNTSRNAVGAGSNIFGVDVSSTGTLEGSLTLGINKESGLTSQIGIKMSDISVLSKANIYFYVENITNNTINNGTVGWQKALIWEIYGNNSSGNYVQLATGNFLQCSETGQKKCVNGDKLYMLRDLQLTYTEQFFDVYIWLDGNIADNGVEDASIIAKVSAETENFSADLE